VSDGAISFYLDHFVRTHVSFLTLHMATFATSYTSVSGNKRISVSFSPKWVA
jgi:hypothetical protein